jgi:hypothetical protein
MRKNSTAALFAVSSVGLLAASSAYAQSFDPTVVGPRVASPAKLGSLLIWPGITINPLDTNDTIIEISNNNPSRSVEIECEYVNELKGRVDFSFSLSPNATASWDVLTHTGDHVTPPPFPDYAGVPASSLPGGATYNLVTRGELVCFAVNTAASTQISFNYLSGTATPIKLDAVSAAQPLMAYRFNAWAFAARPYFELAVGAPDGIVGDLSRGPGTLILDGNANYDACPALNQANFIPNGATFQNLTTLENDLRGVGCYQDLRQDFVVHLTKLLFTVWNSNEQDFTGTFSCVDSVFTVPLADSNTNLNNNTAFDYTTLQTFNAHYQVSGISSDQCAGTTENVGLISESTAQVTPGPGATGADEIGNPTYGEGIFGFTYGDFPSYPIDDSSGLPGFVLWDPIQ